ncbi:MULTISPECIES: metal-dependent hydrolase family protein [Actinomadura]|uniref:Amidohydrolase family protein n=1 Tax=Actinomadura yumaensis TaxID=111807 RepID=A0ABW2CEL2_9ACTN|nr:amidohydrolase family protein [Actinomadura sp. J1-007]MWK38418.1 amidohydrolase family protein [Actinomadura sp. J1-007]
MTVDTIVVAEHMWDGISPEVRGHTEVLISDGRIVACEGRADRPAGARIVELGEATLLPGLIDCHVHCVSGMTSSARSALESLPVLRTLLDNGFTTVRDLGCYTPEPVTLELRRAVEAGEIRGPRMLVAPRLISGRGGHGDQTSEVAACACEIGALADGTDEIVRAVREQVRQGADWIKFAGSGGFSTSVDDPATAGYRQIEMDALVEAARDFGLPTACHALSDTGVRRAAMAGVSTIEHATLADAGTLRLLAGRRIPVVPTQYPITVFTDRLDDESFWADKPGNVREQVRRHADALRAGLGRIARSNVEIAFGSDAGTFDHADNWREFPTLVRSGLSPSRALQAATTVAARVLRRPDLGRIEPGVPADIIAVPESPLRDIDALGHVEFVMQAGIVRRGPGE